MKQKKIPIKNKKNEGGINTETKKKETKHKNVINRKTRRKKPA